MPIAPVWCIFAPPAAETRYRVVRAADGKLIVDRGEVCGRYGPAGRWEKVQTRSGEILKNGPSGEWSKSPIKAVKRHIENVCGFVYMCLLKSQIDVDEAIFQLRALVELHDEVRGHDGFAAQSLRRT